MKVDVKTGPGGPVDRVGTIRWRSATGSRRAWSRAAPVGRCAAGPDCGTAQRVGAARAVAGHWRVPGSRGPTGGETDSAGESRSRISWPRIGSIDCAMGSVAGTAQRPWITWCPARAAVTCRMRTYPRRTRPVTPRVFEPIFSRPTLTTGRCSRIYRRSRWTRRRRARHAQAPRSPPSPRGSCVLLGLWRPLTHPLPARGRGQV